MRTAWGQTPPERSANMSRIRSKDTKPEMLVRKALHRLGFRFRLHMRELPGRPDIVLPKYRTVIQVKGCFWHGHSCPDGRLPKSNRDYWVPKLLGNRRRDLANDRKLRRLGRSVHNLWERRVCTPRKCDLIRLRVGTLKVIEWYITSRRRLSFCVSDS
jgi:DNA mismatch endonuclease (patch repair protein)